MKITQGKGIFGSVCQMYEALSVFVFRVKVANKLETVFRFELNLEDWRYSSLSGKCNLVN